MQNLAESVFQIVDMIFVVIFVIADIMRLFLPDMDILSGITLFFLILGMTYLMMKIIEKEIIFKGMVLFIMTLLFFALIKRVEILNEITAYSTSLAVGIFLLLITAGFVSLDDEGQEYV